jgi:hypothetical protein
MRLMRTSFAGILALTIVSDMTRARPDQLCLQVNSCLPTPP